MSDSELDEIQGRGLSLFDDEENVVSSGDSDSIPSPLDDKFRAETQIVFLAHLMTSRQIQVFHLQ